MGCSFSPFDFFRDEIEVSSLDHFVDRHSRFGGGWFPEDHVELWQDYDRAPDMKQNKDKSWVMISQNSWPQKNKVTVWTWVKSLNFFQLHLVSFGTDINEKNNQNSTAREPHLDLPLMLIPPKLTATSWVFPSKNSGGFGRLAISFLNCCHSFESSWVVVSIFVFSTFHGEMIQFGMFQMVWNHQLVIVHLGFCYVGNGLATLLHSKWTFWDD